MSLYVPLQNYQDMNSTCVTSVTPSCWQVSKSDPQLFNKNKQGYLVTRAPSTNTFLRCLYAPKDLWQELVR